MGAGRYFKLGADLMEVGGDVSSHFDKKREAEEAENKREEAEQHQQQVVNDIFDLYKNNGLDPNELQKGLDNPDEIMGLLADPEKRAEVDANLKAMGVQGIEGDIAGDVTKGQGGTQGVNEAGAGASAGASAGGSVRDVGHLLGTSADSSISKEDQQVEMKNNFYKGLQHVYSLPKEDRKSAMELLNTLNNNINPKDKEMSFKEKEDYKLSNAKKRADYNDKKQDENRQDAHDKKLKEMDARHKWDTDAQNNSSKRAIESKLATKRWIQLEYKAKQSADEKGPDAYDSALDFGQQTIDKLNISIKEGMDNLESGNLTSKGAKAVVQNNLNELKADLREVEESMHAMKFEQSQMRVEAGGKQTDKGPNKIQQLKQLNLLLSKTTDPNKRQRIQAHITKLKQ